MREAMGGSSPTGDGVGGERDEVLVARCLEGSEAAFATLMARHRRMLYGVCLRITGNPNDALDALQETLTRVWRMMGGYSGRARFSTWLYRVATNAALEEVRRRGRAPEPTADDRLPSCVGVAPQPLADTVADRLAVDAALSRLPPHYRAAIVLRELCGCSYEEIADILDVPVNTVKSRISRARQALLALLAPAFTARPVAGR